MNDSITDDTSTDAPPSGNAIGYTSGNATGYATYFGYGSLVNRKTRPESEPWQRATLRGWAREWGHRANRPWRHESGDAAVTGRGVSALSVRQRDGSAIDGVLVPIALADLPLLDAREEGYYRVELPASDFSVDTPLSVDRVIMYVSSDEQSGWANSEFPLIQSYIDCVIDGFNALFGVDGVQRFLDSTDDWTLPLYNDRNNPLYPRAIELTPEQREQTDQWLSAYALNRINRAD